MIRRICLTLSLLLLVSLPSAAWATCGDGASACYGISGNWNVNTSWSATQSPRTSCTCTPATGDSIVLDSLTGNMTVNAAFSIANLDASGGSGGSGSPYTGTLILNTGTTLTVTGTVFKLSSGMTFTPAAPITSVIAFTGAGTLAFTSAGRTIGSLTENGTGTIQLQDAFNGNSNTSSVLTLTQGTFNDNGQTVGIANFATTSASTKALTMSGAWTINGTNSTVWDAATGTNLTVTATGSTLNVVSSAAKTFAGGGKTYGTVNFGPSTGFYILSGANTFASLGLVAPVNIRFPSSTTTTITNAFAWLGTTSGQISMQGSTTDTTATVHATGGGTMTYAGIKDMTFNTGTVTATNSFDFQGNSGVTITPPSGGGGSIIGGFIFNRDLRHDNDNSLAWVNRAG